jgi:hypothetical protein
VVVAFTPPLSARTLRSARGGFEWLPDRLCSPPSPLKEKPPRGAALVKRGEGKVEFSPRPPSRLRGLQRLLEAFSQVPLPRL